MNIYYHNYQILTIAYSIMSKCKFCGNIHSASYTTVYNNYSSVWVKHIKEDIENELLWSIFVDGDNISVSVINGIATLDGIIEDRQELEAAIKNAFEGGAQGVRCHLQDNQGNTYYGEYYDPNFQ